MQLSWWRTGYSSVCSYLCLVGAENKHKVGRQFFRKLLCCIYCIIKIGLWWDKRGSGRAACSNLFSLSWVQFSQWLIAFCFFSCQMGWWSHWWNCLQSRLHFTFHSRSWRKFILQCLSNCSFGSPSGVSLKMRKILGNAYCCCFIVLWKNSLH